MKRYRFIAFIVLSIALIGGIFWLKKQNNQSTNFRNVALTTPTPSVDSSPNTTPPSTSNEQTHIVKKGDTLYSIGLKYNMQWTVIAKYNDLNENAALIEGQKIIIPTTNQSKTIQAHEYKVPASSEEQQSLQSAQDYANAGSDALSYRLDPIQVVQRSLLLSRFAFSASDIYVISNIDKTNGSATIEVTHDDSLYIVYLNQPLVKGDKGVWTPIKVTY